MQLEIYDPGFLKRKCYTRLPDSLNGVNSRAIISEKRSSKEKSKFGNLTSFVKSLRKPDKKQYRNLQSCTIEVKLLWTQLHG